MQLAKFDNGQLITTYADNENHELINLMAADGFKIYLEEQQLPLSLSEFQSQELRYQNEAHQIVGYYEVVDNSPEKVTTGIKRLKDELTATHYQIIKSYEYALIGQPPPYDLTTLHSE